MPNNTHHATFRFYASLNHFLPPAQRQTRFTYPFNAPETVKHLIEAAGIPHTEVGLILTNGRPAAFNYRVQNGDRISVYPAFTTLPDAAPGLLRPPLTPPHRFLLDNHLGRLARYLRLLGFDAWYFHNDLDDPALAQLAHDEGRILLTRDRGLLQRRLVVYGYCLRTTDSRQQLTAVLHRYLLQDQIQPWTRCLRCNGHLQPVAKETIRHRLEPKTKRYFHDFKQCADCQQIYWRGSHYGRLQAFLAEIVAAPHFTPR